MIEENLKVVHENIRKACIRSGRDVEDVTLICVSKTKPNEDILEAYRCGERIMGENKVQEMVAKYETLPKDIQWHMIGHLQRNKVKYLIGTSALIHSVDSIRLANQIELEAKKKNAVVDILVQVNISQEATKFGLNQNEAIQMIHDISRDCSHLRIHGLMTIPPYTEDAETNRGYFRELRELSQQIESLHLDNVSMKELSMGMTGDYEVAVEEGATLVRVGTGIFGNRVYI